MEKYFMIKTEGHVLVITIMQCPESNVVCLECDTEEEVYRLIRKMDCEITFCTTFSLETFRTVCLEREKS